MFDTDNDRAAKRRNLDRLIIAKDDAAKKLCAAADAEGRNLTEAEGKRLDGILAEAEATIKKLASLDEDERLDQSMGRKTKPDPLPGEGRNPLLGRARFGGWHDGPAPARPLSGETTYAGLFPGQRDTHGFRNLHEFFQVLHRGEFDNRLRHVSAAHVEGVGSSGGYLVPPGFLSEIIDSSLESEVIRPRARVIPMGTSNVQVPALDDLDHSTGAPAGFSIQWTSEGEAMTPQTGNLRTMNLSAKKCSIFTKASSELIMDAPLFEREFLPALGRIFGWSLDRAFINGTGAGQPLGILNADSVVTVSKETSQVADTVHSENVRKMFARLHPAAYRNAAWFCNPGVIAELIGMARAVTDPAGSTTVGVGDQAFLTIGPDGGLRLLTRPVIVSEKMPALGNFGDIVLADLSRYLIGMRSDLIIARDTSRYFDSDEIAYRLTARVDGQPAWPEAVTPDNGETLSWAVALEAR